MRFILFTAVILILIVAGPVWGFADLASVVEDQLNHLDLDDFYAYLEQMDRETRELLPRWDPVGGEKGISLDFSGLPRRLAAILWREVVVNFNLLSKLIILAVIASVLAHFQQAWSGESLGRLVENVIYLVLTGLVIQNFLFTLNLARATLDRATGFIYSLLPAVFTLLTAAGGLSLTTISSSGGLDRNRTGGAGDRGSLPPDLCRNRRAGLLGGGMDHDPAGGSARKLAVGLSGLLVSIFWPHYRARSIGGRGGRCQFAGG